MAPTATPPQAKPSAVQVAKYLVKLAHDEKDNLIKKGGSDPFVEEMKMDMTHLKLQKLIYFAQAAHLAINDEELFDEQIEAWPLGPVVRSVYDVFQDHGRDIIAAEHGSEDGIDDYAQSFLKEIWNEFGKYSAYELVNITHRHEPWKHAIKRDDRILDREEMKTFYKRIFVQPDGQPVHG
jgi:uncharacterized phage-associated protein